MAFLAKNTECRKRKFCNNICICNCRRITRDFIRVSEKYGTPCGSDDSTTRFKYENRIWKFDDTDWKKSSTDFHQWLSETYSEKGIDNIVELLDKCMCCDRHAINRLVVFHREYYNYF